MESESDLRRDLKMKLTAKLLPSLLGPREFLCLEEIVDEKITQIGFVCQF